MTFSTRIPRKLHSRWALGALLALIAAVVPTALSIGAASSPDIATRMAAGPSAPAASVSSGLLKAVPALSGPAVSAPPSSVQSMATSPQIAPLGINPALTRAVMAPVDAKADKWYLTPGDDSLCLTTGDQAAGCTTVAQVAHQGLFTVTLPLPAGIKLPDGRPVKPTPTPQVVQGIAPAGASSVQAIDADGSIEQTADVADNGTYRLVSEHATKFIINGVDGPISFPLG